MPNSPKTRLTETVRLSEGDWSFLLCTATVAGGMVAALEHRYMVAALLIGVAVAYIVRSLR